MSQEKVFVVGVGMSKFLKPESHNFSYIDLGKTAISRALKDSGVKANQIESAFAGYVFQDSCAGQRVLYEAGIYDIPVVNVNNNCSTGATAFNQAYLNVKYGISNCAIAVGFETMKKGGLPMNNTSISHPVFKYLEPLIANNKFDAKIPSAPQMFGAAGLEHMQKYDTKTESFNKISEKNYKHGFNNPYAQFRKQYSLDEISKSKMISFPLNKLNCCPTSDGAACVIVCSHKFMLANKLEDQAVEVLASVLLTDSKATFDSEKQSAIDLIGGSLTERAVQKALELSKIKIGEVNVIELHDCFAANELVTYESLGLCEKGKASEFIDGKKNTYGGKFVVNPSGGLTSKGHPLGATGLAQISELTWQLRGMAEQRQVKNAKIALSHNLGLGSAVVVSIFKKFNDSRNLKEHQTSDPEKLEKNALSNKEFLNFKPKF